MSDTKPTTPEQPKTEIVRSQSAPIAMGEHGAEIRTSTDLWGLAKIMAYGQGLIQPGAKPEAVDQAIYSMAVRIQAGKEVGLSPVMSTRAIFVVNGRPSWMVEGLVGVMRKLGVISAQDEDAWIYEFVNLPPDGTEIKKWPDNAACIVRLRRAGWKNHKQGSFSVGDAKLAGLWGKGGPWSGYPKRQLYARASGFLIRDFCPDVTMGLPVIEEARDTPPPSGYVRTVNPPSEPPQTAPQVDPLLQQIGVAPQETVMEAEVIPEPEITIEPDKPPCECPEAGWKVVGQDVTCTACGSVIGPAA